MEIYKSDNLRLTASKNYNNPKLVFLKDVAELPDKVVRMELKNLLFALSSQVTIIAKIAHSAISDKPDNRDVRYKVISSAQHTINNLQALSNIVLDSFVNKLGETRFHNNLATLMYANSKIFDLMTSRTTIEEYPRLPVLLQNCLSMNTLLSLSEVFLGNNKNLEMFCQTVTGAEKLLKMILSYRRNQPDTKSLVNAFKYLSLNNLFLEVYVEQIDDLLRNFEEITRISVFLRGKVLKEISQRRIDDMPSSMSMMESNAMKIVGSFQNFH